jgi:uncharacterized RDD family membrane protein YckC
MSSDNYSPFGSETPTDESYNPYAAPVVTDVAEDFTVTDELASRWARLGGALIDGILLLPFAVASVLMIPFLASADLLFIENTIASTLVFEVMPMVSTSIGYLIINGYLLAKHGQTVGKLIVGTRIVDQHTNRILPLMPLFAKRFLFIQALALIPVIGNFTGLIDALLIFRENRRCLHDEFAGTKVIKVNR